MKGRQFLSVTPRPLVASRGVKHCSKSNINTYSYFIVDFIWMFSSLVVMNFYNDRFVINQGS